MSDLLLNVHNLKKIFPVKASAFSSKKLMLKAVDGVSFSLNAGETVGLVGESGCGKTTVGRSIIRLYDPEGGRAFIEPDEQIMQEVIEMDREIEKLNEQADTVASEDDTSASKHKVKELREKAKQLKAEADAKAEPWDLLCMEKERLKQNRRKIQMVFQDPWASLNPRMLVKDLVGEGPAEYGEYKGKGLESMVMQLLDKVGLPRGAANKYPHEFSGGQRQRIGIARALALTPSLVVCDEPVSALDVSIQAQILNLLISLQDDFNLTYVFIAHDLSVVQYVSDRVAVMYLGKIVELADSKSLYDNPRHPYTISLLSAVPVADPNVKSEQIILEGDVPSPVNPPPGCTFHPRCPYRIDICSKVKPELGKDQNGHVISCHNPPNG
ncbi:MAG: ABC transporter ATP-binding protein [Spirochaetia bacterium]